MFHRLPLFLLLLLDVEHMPMSMSAPVLNSAHVLFMSDCPHVCVCMRNAASQLNRHFSKRAFMLCKDKEHTQVKDRFCKRCHQHTHSTPCHALISDILIYGTAGALTLAGCHRSCHLHTDHYMQLAHRHSGHRN